MTSTDQRVAELRLRMRTEKQSITDAKAQLASVQQAFRGFKDESERTNRVLEQQARVLQAQQIAAKTSNAEIAKFANEERRAQTELNRTTKAIDTQTQSLRARYAAAKEAARAPLPETLTVGGGSQALAQFGREARLAVPAIGIPGTSIGSETVFRVLQITGQLGGSLGSLVAAAGPAALAVGLLAAGIQQFQATIQPVIDLLNRLEKARLEVAGIKAEGPQAVVSAFKEADTTLTGLRAKLAQAETDQASFFQATEGGIQQLKERAQSGNLTLAETAQLLIDIAAQEAEVSKYSGTIKDLKNQIAEQTATLEGLTPAYEAATRAIKEEETAKKRAALADKLRTTQIQLLSQVSSLNTKEIDARIQADRDAQAAIQGFLDAGEGTPEFLEGLRQQFAVLGTEISTLAYNIRPVVEQREREAAAAQKLLDVIQGIPGAVKAGLDSLERLKEAARKLTDVRAGNQDKLRQIQEDLADKQAEAEHDRGAAVIEARRDADLAEAEAVRKAGIDRVEIERQSQANVNKILRRSKIDISNAIQERDAVALDAARQRKRDDLKTEQDNATERLEQLDTNLKEQQRTINLRLKEQLRTIDLRYKDQLRVAQKAAQKSVELEQARYQKELADAVRAYQEVVKIETAKHSAVISAAQQGATAVISITSQLFSALVNQARSASTALNQRPPAVVSRPPQPTRDNPTPYVPPGYRIPQMDTGGRILRDGYYYGHAGETVINPRRGQGGINISVNLSGMTKRRVMREIGRQLDLYTEDLFA